MTDRERFLDIACFNRLDDVCLVAPTFNDFWPLTLTNWVNQGAPAQIINSHFRADYFQFMHCRELHEIRTGINTREEIVLNNGIPYGHVIPPIVPVYKPEIISEDEHTVVLTNAGGQKVRVFADNPMKMPHYLDHPVKDRASWNEYKKRLDPNTPERFPLDWDAFVRRINEKTEPTMLSVGSFFGFLREWTGLERLLYMFHDDPVLVEDMMEQICYMECECIKRVLDNHLRVDFAFFWEDMAFKTGPLISPAMFRKFMVPRYKRITEILRSHGVDIIFVDSDGNIGELISLWMEGGVNGFWPLECAAGMNAVELRKKYGKDIIMAGNIDKRALLKDEEAIREEVMSKLPFLLKMGGYFPSVDHLVPPDVSWVNYEYFINLMREIIGLEKLSI